MAVKPQLPPKSIKDINLSLLHTYNIQNAVYRGCIIHPNGKLILTDTEGCKIILLDDDGKVDGNIPCSARATDVTTIDDRTVAASTDIGIDIINIESKQCENVIKIGRPCSGITHHKGTLLWCETYKGIQKMDLSDGTITILVKQDQLPQGCYVTTHDDKIYQTNHRTKTVTCFKSNGEILWKYRNESLLDQPVGIAVDSEGISYVASFGSHVVVAISANGKDGKQIVSHQEGLDYPYGIYFDRSKNNVLILNNGGSALLFQYMYTFIHKQYSL